MSTLQDKTTPPLKRKQLSENAIRELIRPHVPELIRKAFVLAEEADNDSVKLGAIKMLLSKVAPDLKATEVIDQDGNKIQVIPLLGGVLNGLPKNNSDGEDTPTSKED